LGEDLPHLVSVEDAESLASEQDSLCDPGPVRTEATESLADLDNVIIVLVGPQHPGNIGATARAMKNMGLRHMALVRPHAPIDDSSMQMARGAGDILQNSIDAMDLDEALHGVAITVGTTARMGRKRRDALSPQDAAALLAPLTLRNKVAVLFGPERTGLHNEAMQRCQWVINIPTQADFKSLNLAQAVLILAYELFLASFPKPLRTRTLANQQQLDGMYDHVRQTLLRIGFLDPQNPDRMMLVLKRILARAGLDRREVNILRGIMRQIDWYRRAAAPFEDNSHH
jgi:tRNA/rRNA methyltransferase